MAENQKEGEILTPEIVTENPIEERVSQEIARFNLADSVIAQMKEQYKDLEISGVDDKPGYKAAKEALSIVKKTRTSIEAKRKELKADYLEIGRRIDGEAKRLTENILEIEEPLSAKLKIIDDEIQAEKERKAKEAEQKLQSRVDELNEIGLVFNGSLFAVGNISVDIVTIRDFSDDDYLIFSEKVKIEKLRIDQEEAERIEAERIEAEKRQAEIEKIEAEKKQAEIERQNLENERAELQRMRDELEAEKKKAIIISRVQDILKIGGIEDESSVYFIGETGKIQIGKKIIENWSDDEVKIETEKFAQGIAQIKANDQAKKLEREVKAKEAAEREAKEKADAEQRAKEAAEKAEQKRLARLPDIDKIERYISEINAISIPKMKTDEAAEILSELRAGFKAVIEGMNERISKIK